MPVYVDTPMALAALAVYRSSLRITSGQQHFRPELIEAGDPFNPGRLHLAANRIEFEKLNNPHRPCIVISASGMAPGGRVLHHLEHQLPESRNSAILTGYQVPGTRARMLADGAISVKIHGRYVPVRSEVVNIREYSAHADYNQMVAWLHKAPEPRGGFWSTANRTRRLHWRAHWRAG